MPGDFTGLDELPRALPRPSLNSAISIAAGSADRPTSGPGFDPTRVALRLRISVTHWNHPFFRSQAAEVTVRDKAIETGLELFRQAASAPRFKPEEGRFDQPLTRSQR